jgi:hypothetical protein
MTSARHRNKTCELRHKHGTTRSERVDRTTVRILQKARREDPQRRITKTR